MAFSNLNNAIKAAGPGGTVMLLADKGAYNFSGSLNITNGGTDSAPITVKGVDSAGNPMDIQINGSRPPYSPGIGDLGNNVFKLMDGANNLVFDGFDFHNVQMAFRLGGDIHNITIQNMEAQNLNYFVGNFASGTNTSPTVTDLTIRNVEVDGFAKAAILLQYNTNDVVIDNVHADSQYEKGEIFAMGMHFTGTVHNVLVQNSTMLNCMMPGTSSSYWNGDGYVAESGTYSLRFVNCVAKGNGDAGFDLKSDSTVLENCTSEDNGRNYRFWGDVQLINSVGIDPHVRGGTASQAQIWAGSGAHVTITGGDFVDSGSKTISVIADGATISFSQTEFTHASGAKLTNGSGISGIDLSLVDAVTATGSYSTNGEIYLDGSSTPPPPPPPPPPSGTIDGTSGADTLTGSSGNDVITGGAGNDVIKAGAGDDLIRVGGTTDGFDTVDGGLGYDLIVATKSSTNIGLKSVTGVEEISANGFSSVWIVGSSGNDTLDFTSTKLTGIQGIKGGSGNDTIYGSAGSDYIVGGPGADTMRGNAGADLFKYGATSETPVSAPDKILDFQVGVDDIDLSSIDANSRLTGNQAFTFIGSAAFTKHAGELRLDYSQTGYTKILGDLNGDGVADFAIQLTGKLTLTSGDFIL